MWTGRRAGADGPEGSAVAHVRLPEGLPGILGPLRQFPATGRPLRELTEVLLRGPSSLNPGEREMIAAFVSSRNGCLFCAESHAAAARHLLGDDADLVDLASANPEAGVLSPKMRALLAIAGKVQRDARTVNAADVQRARAAGADDQAIHDTVLVAAAFCMVNRYVDGLATWAPSDPDAYVHIGKRLAEEGYMRAA